MKIIGIIAEYNPIHLGHIYQINKAKKLYPESIIILITNTSFTQRGEPTILNKWAKTKLSLENKIDLIIELPFVYATQSADIFAKGALYILNKLKIDILLFGSESNNIEKIKEIVNTQLKNNKYDELVKKELKKGTNYPTAMSNALLNILGYTTNNPNDLLAISYVKEIIRNKYKIEPVSIKRTNNYHNKEIKSNILNASLIRDMFNKGIDIKKYIPNNEEKYLYKNLTNESYYKYLKYKIITEKDLSIYKTVDEGIENKIKKEIKNSNSYDDLIKKIKTKRYTYNKTNRMLTHILTSLTKKETEEVKIDYIRVLGFNKLGKKHLNIIKKNLDIPIITQYKPNISKLLDIEFRATKIYALETKDNIDILEYKQKPIIKK